MSRTRAALIVACSATLLAGCTKEVAPAASFDEPVAPRVDSEEWVPSFADEFAVDTLDASKWFTWSGELHHKSTTNDASPLLAVVHDGSIFLSAAPSAASSAYPYATGYVDTRGRFAQTYGKIEFRARSDYAPGVWYALWGRSWTSLVPEIDIEFLAENTSQAWFVNHWGLAPAPADERRGFTTVNGLDITQFHSYTILWKPDLIEWQIDGKAFRRVTDPALVPHEPMFWIMNAWVGGWGGTPGPSTTFPAHLEVDHFRVHRLHEWVTPPSVQIANPKTTYSSKGEIAVELADFERGARVDVTEGGSVIATLTAAPFRFGVRALSLGSHQLRFVGTDGSRTASATLAVTID